MWFKNARLFQLNEPFNLTAEALSDALRQDALKPCAPMEAVAKGWVSPFGADKELLVLQSGDAMLFGLGVEEKVLPAAAVNHQLNQQLSAITKQSGHKPGRKQQQDLKQQLMLDMLPQAFIKPKTVRAYLDLKSELLVVDSASQNAAEDLVTQLRQTLGSFKASAFGPSSAMAQVLTRWVTRSEGDAGFELDREIVLETLDETKGVVRGRNIEHLDDQMQQHIDNGYLVTQLGLEFQQRVELVLSHDMGLKKIKLTDVVLDQMDEIHIEDEHQRLDTQFTLFSLEMRALFQSLFQIFGRTP